MVVLLNAALDVNELGLRLIAKTQRQPDRVAIALNPKIYDVYVGTYQLTPALEMTIKSESGRLFAQLPGQPAIEMFPESETAFFCKSVEAQITFTKDETGKVSRLTLHQNGLEAEAPRQD